MLPRPRGSRHPRRRPRLGPGHPPLPLPTGARVGFAMAHIPKQHPIEKLIDDLESKQHNTTWPETMVNAKGVDELLWKGSRRITKVQRVGVALLGLAFVLCGVLFIG